MLSILLLAESTVSSTLSNPSEGSLDFSWLFIKVILAMIFVCAAAYFGIKYLLPRTAFMRKSSDSHIEIIERFPLEPKKSLYILKVHNKHILVGTTDNSINSLLELETKELSGDGENS